ncbi:mitochondrial import receptor subunit Tom22-domain-containing protein [Phlyctochytrium arcticum]|nr:mitochondrial import receptor subunit Tom22-domain-containing protein [Phlyctochytrium arcticum]
MVELAELAELEAEIQGAADAEEELITSLEEDDSDSQYEDEEEDALIVTKGLDNDFGFDDDDEEEEDDLVDESLLERISALVDVIPPTTRQRVVSSVKNVVRTTWTAAEWAGSAAWVVATAAMLVGLPVALELEREQFVFQQEAQMRAQQQQAQQMVQPGMGVPGVPGAPPMPSIPVKA